MIDPLPTGRKLSSSGGWPEHPEWPPDEGSHDRESDGFLASDKIGRNVLRRPLRSHVHSSRLSDTESCQAAGLTEPPCCGTGPPPRFDLEPFRSNASSNAESGVRALQATLWLPDKHKELACRIRLWSRRDAGCRLKLESVWIAMEEPSMTATPVLINIDAASLDDSPC